MARRILGDCGWWLTVVLDIGYWVHWVVLGIGYWVDWVHWVDWLDWVDWYWLLVM